jgi:hypothetical protein
MYFLLTT